MASQHRIDRFVGARGDDYEKLMGNIWREARSLSELAGYHKSFKIDITRELKYTWQKRFGNENLPQDVVTRVQERIDEIYTGLKLHFENLHPNTSLSLNPWKQEKEANPDKTEYAIGIDLGTTMCCVGVVFNGKVEIVQNNLQQNAKITPSYIGFFEDGSDTFGYTAKETSYRRPENTIYDAKRIIGRRWNDPELQKDRESWPFEVDNDGGNPKIKAGGRLRHPHEISARLLCRFRGMAENHLHVPKGSIKKAVVTVPAYFSEPQRKATYEAAVCAGYKVLNILNEPTAAAIAYNAGKKAAGTRKALIYDLGGGTFDVSIAEVKGTNVKILAVGGDSHLGGEDVDQLLMQYCIEKFMDLEEIDLLDGRNSEDKRVRHQVLMALARLKPKCQKAKEWLADAPMASVDIPCISGNVDLSINISKDTLNRICMPLIERTMQIVRNTITDANTKGIKSKEDIDDVILIGGSTRLPLVKQMLAKYFGPEKICSSVNPDEAVAYGAAIQADLLLRKERRGSDPTMYAEHVDVTPLTLGIECLGDTVSRVIPKNCQIPCTKEQIYSTSEDNETELRFTVCQGEREKASENIKLGEFVFKGIPPAPKGQEEIRLTMTINRMGILEVSATSESIGEKYCIVIEGNQIGMSGADIKQLSKELEELLVVQ